MSQRVAIAVRNSTVANRYRYVPKMPRWFYSFVPFKVATGGSSALVSLYLLQLGGSASTVGLAFALASLASMLGALFWGRLSDRTLRRKPFILLGFASVPVFLTAMAFTKTPAQLIAVNTAYAFFLSSTLSVPIALVLRSVRKHSWEYGIGKFNEVSGWGWVLGLVLGFGLSRFLTIPQLFVAFALLGVPSVFMGRKMIREVPVYINRRAIRAFGNYVVEKARYFPSFVLHLNLSLPDGLGRFYLAFLLFWIAAGLYFPQMPVLLTGGGYGMDVVYLALIANSAIAALNYGRVGSTMGGNKEKTLRKGLALRAAALLAVMVGIMVSPLLLPMVLASYTLAGYSWAFIGLPSTAIVSERAGEKEKGSAMGTYNVVSSAGYIAGSAIGGALVSSAGFTATFGLGLALIGGSLALLKR
ncbi:major facilitator superfamily permease 4 [Thermococcus cleftensis]|uniref:Major facilitator superfamily permease 4 n=1 Tax=Thermococcus cleftensis (strain DSM 27260 / KACC 17922 / CL1) TaxID=163003 RepID=I3ZSM3_THECF|nr:MFS transporter [Thermococcus cleftensis]AFL94707.1 major facilitator superfamily permease 4 [Thermococcus cleftensis]